MAKSVKEELSKLFSGGKKPNVFYKGLNTDTDAHAIGNDQYTAAVNARLTNSEQDAVTLQNIKSDGTGNLLSFVTNEVTVDQDFSSTYPYSAISHNSFVGGSGTVSFIQIIVNHIDGTTSTAGIKLNRPSSPFYDLVYPNAHQAKHKDLVGHILYEISQGLTDTTDNFNSRIKTTISPGTFPGGTGKLIFQSLTNSIVSGTVTLKFSTTSTDTYGSASFSASAANSYSDLQVTNTLEPLAAENFGDFVAVVGSSKKAGSGGNVFSDQVVKLFFNQDGSISRTELVVDTDFSYRPSDSDYGYQPIKLIKVDENNKYRRLYFTDGIQPIKTVNLEASASFYSGFDSLDDFNLFSKSSLLPVEITSVNNNGSVNSGTWSYCYKLMSGNGSGSVVSPISNPIPLFPSSLDTSYSDTVGADVGDNSNKSVSIKISDLDTSYEKIQLIGIHYLDNLGSAAFYLLKEEKIPGNETEITLVHNGNETTTSITAFETLVDANTWDIAQDIQVKDNRLFASNLTNSSFNIPFGSSLFRVKQYKHTGAGTRVDDLSGSGNAAQNFDGVPTGGGFVAHTGLINPDIENPLLYLYGFNDTAKYRYAEGQDATSRTYYGASTPSFFTADTGIQITFKQKQFTLDDRVGPSLSSQTGAMSGTVNWWSGNMEKEDLDYFVTAPFYGPTAQGGEDGYFDNYQSPIFANKYTGYMRGEVYRFAIQFYDKQGNNTFSYPIGDIRMPEVMSDYRYNTNPGNPNSGTHISGGFTQDAGVIPPKKFGLCSDTGLGQILYPHFTVKLSESIRNQISGFNIVRAERNDGDETVRLAGILNQTLRHQDETDQLECSNRYGLSTAQLFDANLVTHPNDFGNVASGAIKHEMYTIDSPDVTLGKKSINAAGSQLMVVGQLKPYKVAGSTHPNWDGNDWKILSGTDSIMNYGRDASWYHYQASVYPSITVTPNGEYLKEQAVFSKYYSDNDNIILDNAALASGTADTKYLHTIHYSQNVVPREVISPSLLSDMASDNDGFVNSGIQFKAVSNSWSYSNGEDGNDWVDAGHDSDKLNLFWGNTCHFVNLVSGAYINGSSIARKSGSSTAAYNWSAVGHANEQYWITSKSYVKIIRSENAGRYGGNSKTVFEKQRWINTGFSIHGSNVLAINELQVFGGDTYVNYYSINKKFDGGSAGAYTNAAVKSVQGMIFPVESRVNVDMRRGRYFGKDRPHLNLEDEYLYSQSYSSQNNIKSFPSKDSSIPDVDKLPQTIAVSNIKIAGQTNDSFARFDANESYDLDANYGEINNLITFRNDLYALQNKGVAQLSVNTKSLIKDELGQQITIASGTGAVISDDNYISTTYGSQNRMNAIATERSIYWVDHDNSTLCRLGASGNNLVAQDLLLAKSCRNLLSNHRIYKLNNNPLRKISSSLDLNKEGGIHIYNDVLHGEIGFSINYAVDASTVSVVTKHIVFSEILDTFVTERQHFVGMSFPHQGRLYYNGAYNTSAFSQTNRSRLYTCNTEATGTNSVGTYVGSSNPFFSVTFSVNQDVSNIKVFDKLVATYDGTSSTGVFTKFTFKTNHETMTLSNPGSFIKTIISKDVFPIIDTSSVGRIKGNYLQVTAESTTSTKDINIWSYLTHYRKNLI